MGALSHPQFLRSQWNADPGVGAGTNGLAHRTSGIRTDSRGGDRFAEAGDGEPIGLMLRDKNLVPLSRQHQHALALCVRIDRASPIADSDLEGWQVEIVRHFRAEIRIHFDAEENVLFPAALAFPELNPLVERLRSDHEWLRQQFAAAEARGLHAEEVAQFAGRLSDHIRTEERQLFERLQQLIKPEDFALIGRQLDEALKEADESCALPSESTRLRPAN
jgi:hemerythrin-like domain-containing protein